MSFTELPFYLALAVAALGYYLARGRWRIGYLLGLSYAFYAYASAAYLALLLTVSLIVYAIARLTARSSDDATRGRFAFLGIGAVLVLIVAFKALGAWQGVLQPLGISYFSFKLVAYLVDVYWDEDEVEHDLLVFLLYPAFFPQIVSGPIQRAAPFFRQVRAAASAPPDANSIEAGYAMIIGGLAFKLLVGDRLAAFIEIVDADPGAFTRSSVIANVACYTLQLFADFGGYSWIALGIGKLFGIEGPANFNAPFRATNIQDMWRRWHMSLTSWLTDYLFTPLAMALRGWGQFGQVACITVNMVTIGVWHGFTLNYLVFGVIHAVFLNLTVVWLRRTNAARKVAGTLARPRPLSAAAGMVLTFAMMSTSQIFFHSPSWQQSSRIAGQILGLLPSGGRSLLDLDPGTLLAGGLCAAIAAYVGLGSPGAARLAHRLPRWAWCGLALFALSILRSEHASSFIYGQF